MMMMIRLDETFTSGIYLMIYLLCPPYSCYYRGADFLKGYPDGTTHVCVCTGDWFGSRCHKRISGTCFSKGHQCRSANDCEPDEACLRDGDDGYRKCTVAPTL